MPLEESERLEAVQRALEFSNAPDKFVERFSEVSDQMSTSIIFAREYLKSLNCAREQQKYLCEEAIRAGVQGSRGEIFAGEVARASAALSGRDRVEAEDLQLAVKLCIAPRGTEISGPPPDDDMIAPPPPPPPSNEQEDDEDQQQEEEPPEQEEQDEDQ